MSKSIFFTGQPIFNQLLSFLPRSIIVKAASTLKSDHYCKRFSTYDHLVTMLYAVLNHCNSLREVTTGLLAWESRIHHLGIRHHPRRSTIADANKRRDAAVFESIYYSLLSRYGCFLPDSQDGRRRNENNLYIFDSTTISLFQEILRGSGLSKADGRRKGGLKVHTLLRADQDVPCLVSFSEGAANDVRFIRDVHLPKGSVIVFDKGYRDYTAYNRFTAEGVTWVTRHRDTSIYKVLQHYQVQPCQAQQGIIADKQIVLGHHHHPTPKAQCRMVTYKDPQSGKIFEFITNNHVLSPLTIAGYYRKRWQIELFFKRIKQNYPLQYFLGDNENAIRIQIWVSLIADLLLKVVRQGTATRMSFSNMVSLIRLHIMTYMDLASFLRSPEKSLLRKLKEQKEKLKPPELFMHRGL